MEQSTETLRSRAASLGSAHATRHAPLSPARPIGGGRREIAEARAPDSPRPGYPVVALRPEYGGSVRVLNVAVAVLALIALLPSILAISVAIKLDSKGPIIYRQLRVGLERRKTGGRRGRRSTDSTDRGAHVGPERRNGAHSPSGRRQTDIGGRPFVMHKFRTMRVDAEDGTGPKWAEPEDKRTTRVGALLRRYRLDEIPQFCNVLAGDMSVVGPRPERPSFVGKLRQQIAEYSYRQRVLPGITGWAQVNQAPDQTFEDVREKLRYDLEYIHRRSLAFEFRIMMRTLAVMLRPQPSYAEASQPARARHRTRTMREDEWSEPNDPA